jgi:hypothetical protein
VRILVLGAGVIGSVYAATLLQAGHEVVLPARGRRLAGLRAYGVILEEATEHPLPPAADSIRSALLAARTRRPRENYGSLRTPVPRQRRCEPSPTSCRMLCAALVVQHPTSRCCFEPHRRAPGCPAGGSLATSPRL